MTRGRSLHIYLVDGTPEGFWHVTLDNWTGLGLVTSRAQVKDIKRRPEFQNAGVYVLSGVGDSGLQIYVGQAETLRERISYHVKDSEKDYWDRVVAFTATDASLNKAHVQYLENQLITLARKAGQAEVRNSASSPTTKLHPRERDYLDSFLDNVLLLLPAMGLPCFEKPKVDRRIKTYLLDARSTNARAQYLPEGFLVLEGSQGNPSESPSFQGSSEQKLRQRLIQERTLAEQDGKLVLTKDFLFRSPSAAAGVMAGTGYNGWITWKDAEGRTLDENERAAVEDV